MKTDFLEKQKKEAEERISSFDFVDNVLTHFKQGVIHKSEHSLFPGVLYWVEGKEEEFILDWEEATGNLVYHVIKDEIDLGTMYTLLYVSTHEEEWEMDREDIKRGTPIAYCGIGLDNFGYEYGFVNVKSVNGGLQRTA